MNKIGIMGGTFNPIHCGHLFLAENAYEQAGLDKILFMPSKNPPHKIKPVNIMDQQRVDMINLAIQNNPHFELSEMELNREGLTYTADTLTLLTEKYPQIEYNFIVGTDSLFMMQNWKQPQIIFDHCIVIVAGRDNADEKHIRQHIEYLENTFQARIQYIEMPMIQIASADIRDRIASGKTIRYYMPDAVIEYITKNKLYFADQEDII
ncbi:MAG: nicotinate-nucleotide adenylyltransferase [Herbinix sp.]|nr:nicotinate-nucleotide adenylyltransferase [Herbinix sp.]